MGAHIVFLGPPGSGKGTQSVLLGKKLKVAHVNVGEMLREAIRTKSPVGVTAREYLDRGELVPDSLVIRLVGDLLSHPPASNGFILDGFPRTLLQAEELEKLLEGDGGKLRHAIYLRVSKEKVLDRLTLRLVCGACSAVYHQKYSPPREKGKCDACGGGLTGRNDDRPDVVARRLAIYEKESQPILDYYRKKGILREVDGNGRPEEVTRTLYEVVGVK